MRASDRLGLAVVVSVLLASLTMAPLTQDSSFLGLSWLSILVLGAASIAMRRARIGNGTVLGVQVLILAATSFGLSATMPGQGERWYGHYAALWLAGIDHMRSQAAPMDPNPGVKLIFVTSIGVIMVMTDLLVSGIGRPVWGIAPPAALFLVPALGLGTDTGVLPFACLALGYLGVLIADGLNATSRWTRGLTRDSAEGFGTATPVVWRAATYLGLPAIVTALVLGVALPTISIPGIGYGTGSGNGPLQLTDPSLDLRRNLNQPENREVLEYRSNAPGGLYLRLASLPKLDSSGWGNVQIRLNTGRELPSIPGYTGVPGPLRQTTIRVRDFRSQYLPLPYAPRSVEAPGDWRYDSNSLVMVNGDDRTDALENLTYTVTSADIGPDVTTLGRAGVGVPRDSDVTSKVPADLPRDLIDFTKQVISNAQADTPAEKAAAIQSYLRSSRFTYSTKPLPGSGYEALRNFLLRDHTGYCEQFAGAMATMARVAGIPSRVSVGFLPGKQDGDRWQVSIHDMHAWPELYFANYGWVRFEPTPSTVTGDAPPWTLRPGTGDDNEPTPTVSASASSSTSIKAPSDAPTALAPTTDTTSGTGTSLVSKLVTGGVSLIALLILAAPATIRVRRRAARLSGSGPPGDQVESAWAEIRDSVIDYGGEWPDGSPRAIGREIGEQLDSTEADQMAQVAVLVERSRYARSFRGSSETGQLPVVAEKIRRNLAATRTWRRRIRALLLPASLFRRAPKD